MTQVSWEHRAVADREQIFSWLFKHAGAQVAFAADDKFVSMAAILAENPLAGVQAGKQQSQRKLVIPHFPFILIYLLAEGQVRILRILHTSRKLTARWLSA